MAIRFYRYIHALNTVHPRLRVCAMLVLVVLISLFHTQAHIGHDRSKNGHFNLGQVIYWSTLTQLPDNHSWQSHSLAYWKWWVDWRLVIGGSYINTLLTFDTYLLLICCSSLGWLSGFFPFRVTPSKLTLPLLLYFLFTLSLSHTYTFIHSWVLQMCIYPHLCGFPCQVLLKSVTAKTLQYYYFYYFNFISPSLVLSLSHTDQRWLPRASGRASYPFTGKLMCSCDIQVVVWFAIIVSEHFFSSGLKG